MTESANSKDLAVVACHFNWCNFNTPVRNLHRFIRQSERDELPVYGVELSLTDTFATKDVPNWKHIVVHKNNICFQQYACVNLLEKLVPPQYTKIAWVDHDIMFMNKNWYTDAASLLDKYKLIQLFDTYVGTNRRGETLPEIVGCIQSGSHTGKSGVAWAARRDLWTVGGGLYPYSVMGGGDSIFYHTIYDRTRMSKSKFVDIKSARFIEWADKFEPYINREVSNISGKVFHEWHGDLENKNYVTRHALVSNIKLDDAIVNSDGIIEISNTPDKFFDVMVAYFKNRDEDGNLSPSLSFTETYNLIFKKLDT